MIVKVRQILKDEDVPILLGRTILYLQRKCFNIQNYYLYEQKLNELNEADHLTQIDNCSLKVIATHRQADEVAREGFDDFRENVFLNKLMDIRSSLDQGSIALCLFVDKKLAHLGIMAISEEAKGTFDSLPYHIDFAHGQACSGAVTLPEFRNKGLMTYSCFKRFEFLKKLGYQTVRYAIAVDNLVSQKVHGKFGPRKYARMRHIKIGRWSFYKEIPLLIV